MAEQKEDNVDFINLILMLNQNALVGLGEVGRFVSGKKTKNLANARQTINMLKAVQEKCKNSLTSGETKLLFRVLGDLQAKYVKAAGLDKPGSKKEEKKPAGAQLGKSLDSMSMDALSKLLEELKKSADSENK